MVIFGEKNVVGISGKFTGGKLGKEDNK